MWILQEQVAPPAANGRTARNGHGRNGSRHASTLAVIDLTRFFPGVQQRDDTIRALREYVPGNEAEVIERAMRIEQGDVPLFGLGWVRVGNPPTWTREPITGITAPPGHWSRIPFLDADVVGDHKVLWEFNRHQYLVTLAQAYAYTRDERWARIVADHLRSWIAANPPAWTVNWSSSLEVAYRAISWCWALGLVGDSASLDESLRAQIETSLSAHARHVRRHLSTYFSPNTHLTGEALALFYLGTLCPWIEDADELRATGAQILDSEVDRQVLADGVYFEQATQYHRYTIDIYTHYLLLARASGWRVGARVEDALHRLYTVLLALTRADGTIALLGDDDGGKLVQLDASLPHEVKSVHVQGALALDRADLAQAPGAFDPVAALWLFGADAVVRHRALESQKTDVPRHERAFDAGGVYVITDRGAAATGHATIDCGPHGALSCGHSHADALSIELFAADGPLFVDAGTAAYVGAARNRFRITSAHNTIEIDGTSACEASTSFSWTSIANAALDARCSHAHFDWMRGHHDGYARLASPARHTRTIFHPADGVWIIRDDVTSSGPHDVALHWHAAASVRPQLTRTWQGGVTIELSRHAQLVASLTMMSASGIAAIEQSQVSPQYGLVLDASDCTWRVKTTSNACIYSVIVDHSIVKPDEITIVHAGAGAGVDADATASETRVGTAGANAAGARCFLMLGERSSFRSGDFVMRADMLWVEGDASAPDTVSRVVAAELEEMSKGSSAVAVPQRPAYAVATFASGAWQVETGRLSSIGDR